MRALYRFFRSVRLAVVLILALTSLSLLSTFVPQGREPDFYGQIYPLAFARLVVALGFDRFFNSALFLVPVMLFAVNLGVCTTDRIVKRARAGARGRYGPDLIHIGLLVLLAGGMLTSLVRQEKSFSMYEGEEATLNRIFTIRLDGFEFLKYADGTPKDWISTVSVSKNGKPHIVSYPIEVNHPLRLGGIRIYQSSWGIEGILHMKEPSGETLVKVTGEAIKDGEAVLAFVDAQQHADGSWVAVFEEWKGNELSSTRTATVGQSVGPYTILTISARELTGLKVVSDPGMYPVIVALIVVAAGLCLAFIQKISDEGERRG